MTESLRALIADWRRRSAEAYDVGGSWWSGIGSGQRRCADELEALLTGVVTIAKVRSPLVGPRILPTRNRPCGCEVYQTCERCR